MLFMMDIFIVMWLWNLNGRNALANGQKPTKYRVLTLVLWYGMEILGSFVGAILSILVDPDGNLLMTASLVGIGFAILGGYLSYMIAKRAPKGDYHPEYLDQLNQWNQMNQMNQMNQGWGQPMAGTDPQQAWQTDRHSPEDYAPKRPSAELLQIPATVRIVEELGGYSGGQDAFFLNGSPVCSLHPGSEHTFTTPFVRNLITIGRPGRDPKDTVYAVRFVAADHGYVEIHAAAGKLLPQLFKNYSA